MKLALIVTHSKIDGWMWTIRDRTTIIHGGSGATREECEKDGKAWLRWYQQRQECHSHESHLFDSGLS